MDLRFAETNATEFAVPETANKHLRKGLADHRCAGDTISRGDAGGSTPACVRRDHADKLCEHTRSDHNVWVICATLLYGISAETKDKDLSCGDFLLDLPPSILPLLHRCVNQPDGRRAAFSEIRQLVDRLIESTPSPLGL